MQEMTIGEMEASFPPTSLLLTALRPRAMVRP